MSLTASDEARNPYRRASSLSELLSWNDIDFVRCAYATVLGRKPDEEGEAYYTNRIRSGYSKKHVLWQLRYSDEGIGLHQGFEGLDRALRRAARRRTPIIGQLLQWINIDGLGDERLIVLHALQNDLCRLVEHQVTMTTALLARLDALESTVNRQQIQNAVINSIFPSGDESNQHSESPYDEASQLPACAAEQLVPSGPFFGWGSTLEPGEPWKPLRREPIAPLRAVGDMLNTIADELNLNDSCAQ